MIKSVKPREIPELKKTGNHFWNVGKKKKKAEKLTLILFGAMKKENKSKLKTGTVGKLSPCTKHPELILTLRLKDEPNVEEEEGV